MRTGAPALAAAGLVCAVLVTLVALGGRGDEGQRVALEDPTVTTGDLNADKWRNSIKDLWAKPLGMGVPQPGYKKKSAIVPSLVLNMPMQAPSRPLPHPLRPRCLTQPASKGLLAGRSVSPATCVSFCSGAPLSDADVETWG